MRKGKGSKEKSTQAWPAWVKETQSFLRQKTKLSISLARITYWLGPLSCPPASPLALILQVCYWLRREWWRAIEVCAPISQGTSPRWSFKHASWWQGHQGAVQGVWLDTQLLICKDWQRHHWWQGRTLTQSRCQTGNLFHNFLHNFFTAYFTAFCTTYSNNDNQKGQNI